MSAQVKKKKKKRERNKANRSFSVHPHSLFIFSSFLSLSPSVHWARLPTFLSACFGSFFFLLSFLFLFCCVCVLWLHLSLPRNPGWMGMGRWGDVGWCGVGIRLQSGRSICFFVFFFPPFFGLTYEFLYHRHTHKCTHTEKKKKPWTIFFFVVLISEKKK